MIAASRSPRSPDWRATVASLVVAAVVGAVIASAPSDVWRLLLVALVAPLVEEAIFRAGVQEALLRHGMSSWRANGCTALAFAAAHVVTHDSFAWIVVAVPALATGLLYGRTRRLRHAVALHAAMNAVWLAATASGLWPSTL